MKSSYLLLLAAFVLNSCISGSRMVEFNDQYKEIKGIKLVQSVIAHSADKAETIMGRQYYSVSAKYILEIKKNEPPVLSLDIHFQIPVRPDELDSVMFLVLDDEKIRIVSNEYKYKQFDKGSNTAATTNNETGNGKTQPTSTTYTTENGGYQLMARQFIIPENLWVSIAFINKIGYRLYIGKEGIDVKLNLEETTKLKEFFIRAMQMRDANLPPVPEGQKKW